MSLIIHLYSRNDICSLKLWRSYQRKKRKKKTACNFQTMTMNSVVIPHDERPNGNLGIFANIKLFVVS